MNLAIIWLYTSLACIAIDKINRLRVFKVAADEGYKIDIEKLLLRNKDKYTRVNKITNLICLCIPIYNIYHIIQKTLIFNANKKIRNCILDNLNLSDALENMNELDLEEYSKDKTLKNAIKISLNSKSILNEAKTISINDSTFYYDYNEDGDLVIYKVDGVYKHSPIAEQKRLLEEKIGASKKETLDLYKYFEKFSSLDNTDKRTEKISKLKELKEQLTNKKQLNEKSKNKQKQRNEKNF